MAHHNSTPDSVLNAPTLRPQFLVKHEVAVSKSPGGIVMVSRIGNWSTYHAPADRQKRRGKKAARHAARTAQRAAA